MFPSFYAAGAWLARRWLIGTVLLFALLMAYTSSPIFGQSPPPTPDIQTVPVPAMVSTPTNTPFPTATPVAPDTPEAPLPIDVNTPTTQPNNQQAGQGDTTDNQTGDTTTDNGPSNDNASDDNPAGSNAGGGGVGSGQPANPQSSVQTTGTLTSTLNGTVAITVLNMRKGPSTENAIIDTLFRNDRVQILARSTDGVWWLVCCGADTKRQGWVTARFVQANFDVAQANVRLPIAGGSSAAPAAIVTKNALTAGARITTTLPLTTNAQITPGLNSKLQFQIHPNPPFVWQGQIVNLQFSVTNLGSTTATNVRLRDDLPTTLQYTQAVVGQNGRIQQSNKAQGGSIVRLDWPQLAAGATLTATITLRVTPDLPDGSLIDNLAVVAADNISDIPAGITLAMPPTLMPVFK